MPTSTVPDAAPSAYPKIEYLVDEILPIGEVNLIAGSPGAGKTTLVLQTLRDFIGGIPILGKPSHPAPVVYVSLDRTYQMVCAALERTGIAPGTFPAIAIREQSDPRLYKDPRYLLAWIKSKFPDVKLLFIEALGMLTPNGKTENYGVVADFLCELTTWAAKNRVALWGSLHLAKSKQNEGYVQHRDKIMGSTAWTAFSATTILVEPINPRDPTDQTRRVLVLPREGQSMEVNMTFTDKGQLVTLDQDADKTFGDLMDQSLTQILPGLEVKTSVLIDIAQALAPDIDRRTITRWLDSCLDRGLLERPRHGYYRRPVYAAGPGTMIN